MQTSRASENGGLIKAVCRKGVCIAMTILVPSAHAQKIDSYVSDMREALLPFGTLTASTCHAVEIDLTGPWGHFAIPEGTDKVEPTWSVVKVDILRLYVDLSDLDEEKVLNNPFFSLEYLGKHQKGTRYIADTPVVMLRTHGLNATITVHTVDLNKVDALRGQAHVPESKLGLVIDARKYAFVTFSDQEHADVFQKAIQKAIVLCKAQ